MASGRQDPARAAEFARKLAETGLRASEFAKLAGFSRGALYHLSRGQPPSSSEQAEKLAVAFTRLRRK